MNTQVVKKEDTEKKEGRTTTITTTRFPGFPDDQIVEYEPTQIRDWSIFPKFGGKKKK